MTTSTRDIIRAHQRRVNELELQQAQQGLGADPKLKNEIDSIRLELSKLMIRDIVIHEAQPPRFKGLMLLIGPGQTGKDPFDQSAMDAIKYHTKELVHCWMIGSSGTRGSEPVIEAMQLECEHLGVKTSAYYVDDPFVIQPTYELVERLYAEEVAKAALTEQDVIADITGATKPMSFGMLYACGASRAMQYMVRRPKGPSTPMMLRSSFD